MSGFLILELNFSLSAMSKSNLAMYLLTLTNTLVFCFGSHVAYLGWLILSTLILYGTNIMNLGTILLSMKSSSIFVCNFRNCSNFCLVYLVIW